MSGAEEVECEIVEECWVDPACRCVDAPEEGRCQGCEDAPVGMTVVHDATCTRRTCHYCGMPLSGQRTDDPRSDECSTCLEEANV